VVGIIYVLVQVVVLMGVGGSGGEVGRPYAEQSRALRSFASMPDCAKGLAAMKPETAPVGTTFVCVPVENR
jgi:hypothetical protein